MAQIAQYNDDALASRLNAASKSRSCSVTKFVATVVSEYLANEESERIRKERLLADLQGALNDPTFALTPDIPWEADFPRRFDLI